MYYNSVSGAVWLHKCVFYYYSLKRAYALWTHFCMYDTFWSKTFKKTERGVVKYKGAQLKISNSAKNTLEDLEVIITTSHLDFGWTRLCSSTFKCNNSCCSQASVICYYHGHLCSEGNWDHTGWLGANPGTLAPKPRLLASFLYHLHSNKEPK